MAFPKIGLYLGRGREVTGSVAVADIQMPGRLMGKNKFQLFLTEEKGHPKRLAHSFNHSA